MEHIPGLHNQLETSIKISLAAILIYTGKERDIKILSPGSNMAFVKKKKPSSLMIKAVVSIWVNTDIYFMVFNFTLSFQ